MPAQQPSLPHVALQEPSDDAAGNGYQHFTWQTDSQPGQNQGFELIFWPTDLNAMSNGFGLAAPTKNTTIGVDLDALDGTLRSLFEPGTYYWGVLLVQVSPYERLGLVSDARTFHYQRARSGNSSNNNSDTEPSAPDNSSGTSQSGE